MKKIEWETLYNLSDGSNFVDIVETHLNLFSSKLLRTHRPSSSRVVDSIKQIKR